VIEPRRWTPPSIPAGRPTPQFPEPGEQARLRQALCRAGSAWGATNRGRRGADLTVGDRRLGPRPPPTARRFEAPPPRVRVIRPHLLRPRFRAPGRPTWLAGVEGASACATTSSYGHCRLSASDGHVHPAAPARPERTVPQVVAGFPSGGVVRFVTREKFCRRVRGQSTSRFTSHRPPRGAGFFALGGARPWVGRTGRRGVSGRQALVLGGASSSRPPPSTPGPRDAWFDSDGGNPPPPLPS